MLLASMVACGGGGNDGRLDQVATRSEALTSFAVSVVSTDATSVKLKWTPLAQATEYVVARDGVTVGSSVAKTGKYTDFGLAIGHLYHYSVTALDANGVVIGASSTVSATTTTTTAMRTGTKILALAFNPSGESLKPEQSHLEHRIEFLKLASAGSANITLYGGKLQANTFSPVINPSTGMADYVHLATRRDLPGLGGNSIVDLVENEEVDHVWVAKSPNSDWFWENTLLGSHPIQGNSGQYVSGLTWDVTPVKCSRSFFVNYFEPDQRAWDAYAHMVEGIMTSVSEGHPETFPKAWQYTVYTPNRLSWQTTTAQLNLFQRFRLGDEWTGDAAYASPGNGNCGTSHYPPNTPRSVEDYAYKERPAVQRYIDSKADDWLMYPGYSNNSRKINGYDYGAFHEYVLGDPSYAAALAGQPSELHPSFNWGPPSYHQWWFGHLPHNPDTSDGKLNNWWGYLFDFNHFDGSRIDYTVTGAPTIPTSFAPVGAEYGTDDAAPNNWGFWNSQNGAWHGAMTAELTTVRKTTSPAYVRTGNYALKVSTENTQESDGGGAGRNDVFYPQSRNAHFSLRGLKTVKVSIKLGQNPGLLAATNPVIRLYKNGGNRIELVPIANGAYTNVFANTALRDPNGWYNLAIPLAGNASWEKNVIGYIDPALTGAARQQARANLEQAILLDVNYVEVSIRSLASQAHGSDDFVSYYLDDFELVTGP